MSFLDAYGILGGVDGIIAEGKRSKRKLEPTII